MATDALLGELSTPLLKSTKDTFTYQRRKQNVEWVRNLSLEGLRCDQIEIQLPMAQSVKGEKIVIQYPGWESLRKKPNLWDFRPKILGKEDSDLTFAELWDPVFKDLKSIPDSQERKRVAAILATLYYRIAFLVDYADVPKKTHMATKLWIKTGQRIAVPITLGPFWTYKPPVGAVKAVSDAISDWAGMSFEAFLHYNSLLAWNEDMKIRATYDNKPKSPPAYTKTGKLKKPKEWNAREPAGRINTLLTYIHVVGFILEEVTPSTLLGGFMRQRGMSSASDEEVLKLCEPYIRRAEASAATQSLETWGSTGPAGN